MAGTMWRCEKDRDAVVKLNKSGTEKMVVQKTTATTNDVKEVLALKVDSTGTPAAGLGGYISYYIDNAAGENEMRGRIMCEMETATNGAEDSRFRFWTQRGGTLANRFTIDSNGTISSGGDISFTSSATMALTDNLASALNIAEGANSYLKFVTTNSGELMLASKKLRFGDSVQATFGDADDIAIAWDGTDMDITQAAANSSITLGVDGAGIDFVLIGDTASVRCTWDQSADSLVLNDNAKLVFGTGSDVSIAWDGTDLDILAAADNSVITVGATGNAFDLSVFGSSAATLTWDCSADTLTCMDNAKLAFGDSDDVTIAWDGTDLDILAAADNSTITIGASGNSFDVKLFGADANGFISWDASANDLKFEDSTSLMFGTGAGAGVGNAGDVEIRWDGTDLDILAAANNSILKIGNGTNSFDVWIMGGAAGTYISWDASANDLKFEDSCSLMFGTGGAAGPGTAGDVELRWDGTDLDLLATANNTIFKIGDGTTSFDVWLFGSSASAYVSWDASANDLKFEDSVSLMFGTGAGAGPGNAGDVELRWDATDLDLIAAANNTVFKVGDGTNSFDLWLYGSSASNYILWDASANTMQPVGGGIIKPYVAHADPGNAGAIPVTSSGYCPLVTAGAETRTLAAPTYIGQEILLYLKTDSGDCVVTCATTFNETGNNTITFNDTGDAFWAIAVEEGANLRWRCATADGCTLSTV